MQVKADEMFFIFADYKMYRCKNKHFRKFATDLLEVFFQGYTSSG